MHLMYSEKYMAVCKYEGQLQNILVKCGVYGEYIKIIAVTEIYEVSMLILFPGSKSLSWQQLCL
jgi:hypothetical protein